MTQGEEKSLSELIIETLKLKGMTLEKLSQSTGVSESSLELLIEERFTSLPSAPYVHGYLMKIAEALNLDGNDLWQRYLRNNEELRRSGEEDLLPHNRFITKEINKKVVVIIAGLVIVAGYFALRLPSLFGTPELTLKNLGGNPTVVQSVNFLIEGNMDPSDTLSVNGEMVYPDKEGYFKKSIVLQPGFNTLVFQVKQLLGNAYSVTKQIYYETVTSSQHGAPQNSQNNITTAPSSLVTTSTSRFNGTQ